MVSIMKLDLCTIYIYLYYEDKCKINNEGIKHLCKANWPKLSHLKIGNIYIYQINK